ncbi:hypothetical protein RKQ56_07365 [Acinetobacter baumannii]|uniref:Uncharacterized protein n=1 Tax=Acinetobacter baumannii TaxID=470 RepID=A0AB73FCK0_ACIBA|nr:hypothetical protein [Acinetobacter baumannii]KQD15281.1 hypothetical protein APD06_13615 [Acinetobacter baumannii]MDU7564134.1 hypothetical protein [Acinetobacter baumannii]OTU30284.1 hypothetical protein CAT61_08030 [Acinetobacter baumannii]QLB35128.1 hypothetical protein GQO96_07320 [Acinetobacter baumannii]QLB36510.1 hypothetical protein GQO96_14800 [Acinetobacter baumannii]
MEKFEEYFRTTKHYENMLLDIARNQLSVSVFDKNGRKYRNHIVQTAYEVFQHQQAKVEELQTQLSLQRQRVKAFEEELTSSRNYGDELQKRVDELEFQLKDWKQKSMPAMLNGMCGRCGKEPLQGIGSDKEDYALLHCFGCGANKYEWIGEQALKGEG